jgi:hypothetical protein
VNKVILKWQRPLWEGGKEVLKRSARDELMWVAIHKYMEATLGISLYSYIYLKLEKQYVFLSIAYVFSSTNSENKGRKWGRRNAEGGGTTMYTHVSKCKKC